MSQTLTKRISESKAARWTALIIVSFTMMWGYFLTDALSPLMTMLEEQMGWTSLEFGQFNWAYCWFNVFLFMLIFGVRFDVYTRTDKGEIIDVEIQTADTGNLPKRIRAYHSMITRSEMDIRKMKNYNDIHKAYVIFICLFDLFGKGRHIYTFKNICVEDTSIELNDGASTIFLNAKGVADDVSPRMKAFLNLTMGIKSDDSFVKRLEAKMEEVLMTPEMEWEYWAQKDLINRARLEGQRETARRMRDAGFSDEQICSLTGLSPEDLSNI